MGGQRKARFVRHRGSCLSSLHLAAGSLTLLNRTARLASPENLHPNSGDSDGDEEDEGEDAEEEDVDPLAELPDETEVHIIAGVYLINFSSLVIRNSTSFTPASHHLKDLGSLGFPRICKGYV